MKLPPEVLSAVTAEAEVKPGNVYAAMGGRKSPGTEFWLVVATTSTGAACIGFDKEGNPRSAQTYLKGAMRSRPVLARINVENIRLETT